MTVAGLATAAGVTPAGATLADASYPVLPDLPDRKVLLVREVLLVRKVLPVRRVFPVYRDPRDRKAFQARRVTTAGVTTAGVTTAGVTTAGVTTAGVTTTAGAANAVPLDQPFPPALR